MITTERTLKIQVPTEWATEWPCSKLAGKEINVAIDCLCENSWDLIGYWITDEPGIPDLESAELTAVVERHLDETVSEGADRFPKEESV
tara:strand:- start:293 stop:559 length:267 start_codon:yes stop_codon:yes gene_type:complete